MDNPLYWDPERNQIYWIEWEETGNNDIPHRHYVEDPRIKILEQKVTFLERIVMELDR